MQAYFTRRFDRKIRDGLYTLQENGTYFSAVAFWSEVGSRAMELYERSVTPGQDYVLTEVVHRKSRKQEGVFEDAYECSERYLSRVLSCAAAKIIVILGETAKGVVTNEYGIDSSCQMSGPIDVDGRERFLVFLPAPNSNQPRKFASVLSAVELSKRRKQLKS